MTYSYLGLAKPIKLFDSILKEKISEYRKANFGIIPELECGGVFSNNTDGAAAVAIDNGMCVYTSQEKLLDESDIIFLFLSEKSLREVSLKLSMHPVKGKIFCHFSPGFDASIIDYYSGNTYVSMSLVHDQKMGGNDYIIAEGYGRRLEKLQSLFDEIGLKCVFVSKEEKLMYQTAVDIAKNMTELLNFTAKRLARYALASHDELSDYVQTMLDGSLASVSAYNPAKICDDAYIEKQCKVLISLGIPSISNLYCSLLDVASEVYKDEPNSERIHKLAHRNIKKSEF